jgi:hypothetical protein
MTSTTQMVGDDLQRLQPAVGDAEVVVPAPGAGPGHWAGGPSAVLHDGVFHLAYRLRRPVTDGRGFGVAVARSVDGVHFDTVALVARDRFGAASLERPALVRRPDGGWRIYVSCATPGSCHWWVEAVDADLPEDLGEGRRTVVWPGDDTVAVKDPVVRVGPDGWEAWACCHPLDEVGAEDRMVSRRAVSADGLDWRWTGEELSGTAGTWDARGARVTAMVGDHLLYDGRATAAENWEERTGLARHRPGAAAVALLAEPFAVSPHASGSLRYVDAVALPGGGHRLYFEAARPDGAHDLLTQVL